MPRIPSEQPTTEPLSGRSILVAGGTGNVGRHIVAALLERGATVVVPSRSTEKIDSLRAALRAAFGPVHERLITLTGDVADPPSLPSQARRSSPSPPPHRRCSPAHSRRRPPRAAPSPSPISSSTHRR